MSRGFFSVRFQYARSLGFHIDIMLIARSHRRHVSDVQRTNAHITQVHTLHWSCAWFRTLLTHTIILTLRRWRKNEQADAIPMANAADLFT